MSGSMAFLLWTKGPMFNIAIAIFAIGLLVRIAEIFMLGRKKNFAEARAGEWVPGLRTMVTRTVADPGSDEVPPAEAVA